MIEAQAHLALADGANQGKGFVDSSEQHRLPRYRAGLQCTAGAEASGG
jgi:hypothetical protein